MCLGSCGEYVCTAGRNEPGGGGGKGVMQVVMVVRSCVLGQPSETSVSTSRRVCTCLIGGIPFAQVKQLMRFRTGAHHFRVETGRWLKPRLPRSLRVCQKCTWGSTAVEDEYHVLFECPAYHRIRLKYETALFSKFGGVSRVARSMKFPGKVSAFMDQEPRKVAAFVSECLD